MIPSQPRTKKTENKTKHQPSEALLENAAVGQAFRPPLLLILQADCPHEEGSLAESKSNSSLRYRIKKRERKLLMVFPTAGASTFQIPSAVDSSGNNSDVNTSTISTLFLVLVPAVLRENVQLVLFLALLTYALLLVNWIVTTDWQAKFHWCSLTTCALGILYLHYSDAVLVLDYEAWFMTLWIVLLMYHASTWKNQYKLVQTELDKSTFAASLRPIKGSVLRFLITMPTTKNASNQWNPPPFHNAIHVILCFGYTFLLVLHVIPFMTPMHCINDPSPLCCRYNYVMQGFDSHEVHQNYCSGRVRIAFAGGWSTGKTTIINALLGHVYKTAQTAPAPTTDKFVCLALGAPYSDPIHSDDYSQRQHCEIMSHINDVNHKICGATLPNVLDVADTNTEFADFVFFDMPGWQREYGEDCTYRMFYQQLMDKVDFIYVVCK